MNGLDTEWKIPTRFTQLLSRGLVFVVVSVLLHATPSMAQGKPEWISGEIIVGFQKGVSKGRAKTIYNGLGASSLDENPAINAHLINVPPQAQDAVERALSKHEDVKFVESNRLLPPEFIPDDPSYASQWHLPKISAPLAWDMTTGHTDVIIAILDSGVDCNHPDLSPKCVPGWNFMDGNEDTTDVYGHGTKVAGSATANGNNGIGVAGVAWQNDLMPIRVSGTDGWASYWNLAQGLTWAMDHGAKVMNMSFEGVAGSSSIRNAADYVVSQGGVVVAAAGNCGCFDSTGEAPSIISVSATTSSDGLAGWSSRGSYVDVSAPGSGIWTTLRGGGYGSVSGTSFASPVTAGVVGLIMSVNAVLTSAQIKAILEDSSVDLGIVGYDTSFGYGRVNADTAVSMALATEGNAPPQAVVSASPTSGTAPVEVTFDGSQSSDPDGTIVSYQWNFGDGTTGSGPTPSHTYTTSGTFTATLTVKDDMDSTSSDTVQIAVDPDPTILNPPSNLGGAVAGYIVTIVWTDNSGSEDGFYVERGIKVRGKVNFSRIGQVGANVTSFSETPSDGTYRYRVQAFTTEDVSGYSNTIQLTVGTSTKGGSKSKGKSK